MHHHVRFTCHVMNVAYSCLKVLYIGYCLRSWRASENTVRAKFAELSFYEFG